MTVVRRLPPPREGAWDWQLRAACRGLDTAMFYSPDNERGPTRARREQDAKQVCSACPVLDDCLRWALRAPEPYGVWGGLTVDERAEVRRQTA